MSVLQDPDLGPMLTRLHQMSDAQIGSYNAARERQRADPQGREAFPDKAFLSDKLVALDRDKGEFCYQLCRAGQARRIVEIGTSYGVSTLYLAAAIRDTIRAGGGTGRVIGTEYEPNKAAAARLNFAEAGLDSFIELREGDLRQTLKQIDGPVDFMLVDIWVEMARPALELVAPHLRPGAIVVADNTARYRAEYAAYFAFINDEANGFRTMTLPFDGGFELSVRV